MVLICALISKKGATFFERELPGGEYNERCERREAERSKREEERRAERHADIYVYILPRAAPRLRLRLLKPAAWRLLEAIRERGTPAFSPKAAYSSIIKMPMRAASRHQRIGAQLLSRGLQL